MCAFVKMQGQNLKTALCEVQFVSFAIQKRATKIFIGTWYFSLLYL